jgi:hypothetical protein
LHIVASLLISLAVAFGLFAFYLKRLPPGASGGFEGSSERRRS